MVNLWYKYKCASKRKQQTLHSVIVGFVVFCVFYAVTKVFSVPLCLFKNIFGVPCPGCGLTRGFIAILHLNFKEATRHHILSVPIFWGTVMYSGLSISDILLDRNDLEKTERFLMRWYMIVVWVLLLTVSLVVRYII